MHGDNPAENTREARTGTPFAADAVTTRTFDNGPVRRPPPDGPGSTAPILL
ncbi:hypothetical protein AB0N06_12540 [Streptomyces sp. NPDC051020]|uniref:hypothetical protein n=1 Tax=Streptomyces sp. NPDC051020 TaxID=3155409 RepID=UPI00342508DE